MSGLCGCGRMMSHLVSQHLYTCQPLITRCHLWRRCTAFIPQSYMSSVLYASRYKDGNVELVDIDLNLKERFKNIRKLYENICMRNLSQHINVYHMMSMYKALSDVEKKKIELESEKLDIATKMSHIVKAEQTRSVIETKQDFISRGKEVRESLKLVNKHFYTLEEELLLYALQLPNDLHPDTPEHKDEILKEMGTKNAALSHRPVGHMLIGKKTGTIFKKNVGPIKLYLRNEAAALEQDLCYHLSQQFSKLGFTHVSCPDMVKTIVVEGTGQNIFNPKQVYVLQDGDQEVVLLDDIQSNKTLHLAGASPQAFAAAITKMNIKESSLPLKWFTVHTKYDPSSVHSGSNLFGSTQSTVVEIFGGARDENEATGLYREIYTTLWSLYSILERHLHVRLVSRCPSKLAPWQSTRVDIQVWSYGTQEYIQVGSVALWSDYIGRRLMAKWSPHVDEVLPGHFLHTVHGTAFNITALIGLLMEAHQAPSGHFKFPADLLEAWSTT